MFVTPWLFNASFIAFAVELIHFLFWSNGITASDPLPSSKPTCPRFNIPPCSKRGKSNVGNVPAKLIKSLNKKEEVVALKGAYVEECFYGADALETLVAIKSKNELIADVIALLQSPAKNVISALQSGANTIHGVLKTLGERPE